MLSTYVNYCYLCSLSFLGLKVRPLLDYTAKV
nr:MAG TPA: hypothetical protein [Caudoviricetes sp.]